MPESPLRAREVNHGPVVASLARRNPQPYSSLSLSPEKDFAVTACKDTLQILQISSQGIALFKTIPIVSHFQSRGRLKDDSKFWSAAASATTAGDSNVTLTDVAWSPSFDDESFIAASGSNGVIAVWKASMLLEGKQESTLLCQHTRTVNRLDWHPTLPGLLLSAGHDSKAILWERKAVTNTKSEEKNRFFFPSKPAPRPAKFSWSHKAFEPKAEAIRDIRWSPFHPEIFAMVTSSGSLILYHRSLPMRALGKLTAHTGDATALDWHPTRRGFLATGGSGDRCVKVWDLDDLIAMRKDDDNMQYNVNTLTSRGESVGTEDSLDDRPGYVVLQQTFVQVSLSHGSRTSTPSSQIVSTGIVSFNHPIMSTVSSNPSLPSASRHGGKGSERYRVHILYISASVTRLQWRPQEEGFVMAVATAPVKGASAGGSGQLALWSCRRPYMPLSVLEGHKDGAVTDFDWIQTPPIVGGLKGPPSIPTLDSKRKKNTPYSSMESFSNRAVTTGSWHEVDFNQLEADYDEDEEKKDVAIWQHVVSVGRDGRCLIQSFVRGDRPITRTPPSSFAMANLSPFQQGYGSLQIFSVYQPLPVGPREDFILTGLRQDPVTAMAEGIFREDIVDRKDDATDSSTIDSKLGTDRIPYSAPEMSFNVIDEGDLDTNGRAILGDRSHHMVAPEVVHLSRFASMYELQPTDDLPTQKDLCEHNAEVADSLQYISLAHMWRLVASMVDQESANGSLGDKTNGSVMNCVLMPTVKSILEERAEAGDVQTCVALCEVLDILGENDTIRIPDLPLMLVREWYLSYIDLLRDMCLYSYASEIIRQCKDSVVGALNQQSTTYVQACFSSLAASPASLTLSQYS